MDGANTRAIAFHETTCVEADVLLALKRWNMDRLCARAHGEPTVRKLGKSRLREAPTLFVGNDTARNL